MAKNGKMKGWVKGLIAVAVIAAIGGLGYYGTNGELFQGRLDFFRSNSKLVAPTDKVVKPAKPTDKVVRPVSMDNIVKLKDGDREVMKVDFKNTDVNTVSVSEVSFSTTDYDIDSDTDYGVPHYSLVIDGQKVNAKVKVKEVKKDGKLVKVVSFVFEEPLKMDVNTSKSFEFVSIDKDDMQYDFNSVTIDNEVMTEKDLK